MGVYDIVRPSTFSNCKKVEVSHAARELATVFSVTLFFFLVTLVVQLVRTPLPQQKVSRHTTESQPHWKVVHCCLSLKYAVDDFYIM